MAIRAHPPPEDGPLVPSGSPPTVTVDITVPNGGTVTVHLHTRLGTIPVETVLLGAGTNRVQVTLPNYSPGDNLTFTVQDYGGEREVFRYTLG